MSSKERTPLSEVTPQQVYSKAREILDLYGNPETADIMIEFPSKPGSRIPNMQTYQTDITKAPVVDIQIDNAPYRLWLKSEDDPRNHNKAIELVVHYQQFPNGFDHVDYNREGRPMGFWYKSEGQAELKYNEKAIWPHSPKELDLFWYIGKVYTIEPDSNSIEREFERYLTQPRLEIIKNTFGEDNDFLLTILEKMQTELDKKPA